MSNQVFVSVQNKFSGRFAGNENAPTSVSVPAIPAAHEAVTAEASRSPRVICARTPIDPRSIAELEAAMRGEPVCR